MKTYFAIAALAAASILSQVSPVLAAFTEAQQSLVDSCSASCSPEAVAAAVSADSENAASLVAAVLAVAPDGQKKAILLAAMNAAPNAAVAQAIAQSALSAGMNVQDVADAIAGSSYPDVQTAEVAPGGPTTPPGGPGLTDSEPGDIGDNGDGAPSSPV